VALFRYGTHQTLFNQGGAMSEKIPKEENANGRGLLVWELVQAIEKDLMEREDSLSKCRATLLVNYGPEGRNHKIIKGDDSLVGMIVKVLTWYEKKIKALEAENKKLKEIVEKARRAFTYWQFDKVKLDTDLAIYFSELEEALKGVDVPSGD
jgi:hypothetical protein